jgi:hypothetical protein
MVSLFESEKSSGTDTSVKTHYIQESMVMAPQLHSIMDMQIVPLTEVSYRPSIVLDRISSHDCLD